MKKKAGVVVDDWKLPVFRKRLEEGGFTYEDRGAGPGATTILMVPFEPHHAAKLTALVTAANLECAKAGPPK